MPLYMTPKNVTVSDQAPTADDDATEGFAPLSQWQNAVAGPLYEIYVCHDNTIGAAVWRLFAILDENGELVGPIIPEAIDSDDPPVLQGGAIGVVDGHTLILGDGVTAPGNWLGLPMRADSFIIAQRGMDDVESAANLRAAYAAACALTPGGNALSATNRATCLVPPGRYDLGTGDGSNHGLLLDTNYVDLVSLTGSPEDTILTASIGGIFSGISRGTLEQTADDVLIQGIQAINTFPNETQSGANSDDSAYFPATNLANTKVRNCIFRGVADSVYPIRSNVIYAGTYENVFLIRPSSTLAATVSFAGKFFNIRLSAGTFTFPAPTSGARLLNCLDGNGQIVNWPNGTLNSFGPLDNEPPAANAATIDVRAGQVVLDFDASINKFSIFRGIMPQRYTGHGLSVRITFTSDATSGNAIWGAQFERCNTDSDSDSFATAQLSAVTAVNGTSGISSTATIAFTNSQIDGLLAGEEFRLRVYRDANNALDTVDSNDLELRAVEIRGAA